MLGGEDRPLTIVETPSLAVPVIGDLQALASVRTVHGSGEVAAPPGPVAATTSLQSLLVVPVVEPGQTFSGGTNAYHAQLEEPLQVAVEYYREQTYKDVGLIYEVFGRDTPGLYSGGPVGLTKKIRSFYHPPFEPGGLRGESTQPGRVTFTGQEGTRSRSSRP
jgi:hypothetical protein